MKIEICQAVFRIKNYDVFIRDDMITVITEGKIQCEKTIKGLGDFVKKAKNLKSGWGQFQDLGDEVIYIYDKNDDNFGYALNLDDDTCSEWGYCYLSNS